MDIESGSCQNSVKVSQKPHQIWKWILVIIEFWIKNKTFFVVCVIAEGIMENSIDISVSELRSRLWRFEHFSIIRLQEHIRRRHSSLWDKRRDLRRLVIHLLDDHSRPSLQIRLHRPQSRRQRRRRDLRSLLPPLSTRPSQLATELPAGGRAAHRVQDRLDRVVVGVVGDDSSVGFRGEPEIDARETRSLAEDLACSCFDRDLYGDWWWCSYACYFR